jgi:hypothetical protein
MPISRRRTEVRFKKVFYFVSSISCIFTKTDSTAGEGPPRLTEEALAVKERSV